MSARRRQGMRAAPFAAALAAALLAAAIAQTAHAATLDKGGFSNVPADTVNIDYPLKIANATFTRTNSTFKVSSTSDIWGAPARTVIYDAYAPAGRLSGSFTLKWSGCGTDASGAEIDLAMTVSNVQMQYAANRPLLIDDGIFPCLDASTVSDGASGVRMDIEVKITKHGTSTPASGTCLVAFNDIDVVHEWPEQVELLSGFGNRVWVTPTNFLSITNNATRFTATRIDSETYDSGFVATSSSGTFKIRWQGYGCGTFFLMPFKVGEQSITASAGAGGGISDPGKTELRWKNDKTYTITPSAHHRIKDVKVDGKSVGAVSTYTFRSVTGHHTIHATFEALPKHTVTFVDGFGTTLSTQSVEEGGSAQAPPDPEREGWAFTGWDTPFTNVRTSLTVTAQWDPVIAVRIPTLVACQIQRDGSVTAPPGYAIENLSPVPVELETATTSNMPPFASYTLEGEDGIVHAYENGADSAGSALEIGVGASAPLTWSIGDLAGDEAQELLLAALEGPTRLCDVRFVFKQA